MKELFLLLSLTMAASDVTFPIDGYEKMWSEVNAAIQDDKPQTAVELLGELDKMAEAADDTLELYEIRKVTLEQLQKYDWKSAAGYQPKFDSLHDLIMSDLDGFIERYATHPRVVTLIYEKINGLLGEESCKDVPSAEQYQKIRKMCELALREFPNSMLADSFRFMIESMDSQSLKLCVNQNTVYPGQSMEFTLVSRNVKSADLSIYSLNDRYDVQPTAEAVGLLQSGGLGAKVCGRTICDFAASYNIPEKNSFTHTFDKPGIYVAVLDSGDNVATATVYVSSVAMMLRETAGKNQIYVADAVSGKPAAEATVHIYDMEPYNNDASGVKAPQHISDKRYDMFGFTALNQLFLPAREKSYEVYAEVASDKYCAPLSIWQSKHSWRGGTKGGVSHYIFTDRKLYRPDDTIQFKLIALSTNGEKGKVLAGRKISVSLYAPGEKEASATLSLTTNVMGSAAGSFYIPAGNRNGSYRITDGEATAWVRVEEYKDPGFRIIMPDMDAVVSFGSPVVQKGVAKGYAGNSVTDARVEYTVERVFPWYYESKSEEESTVARGTLYTDNNGCFDIQFTPEAPPDADVEEIDYKINVKVTDMGGETFSQSKHLTVSRNPLALDINCEGLEEGGRDEDGNLVRLMDKEKAKCFTVTVRNTEDVELKLDGSYTLFSDGEPVEYGKFISGELVYTNLKRLPSGTYTLECVVDTEVTGKVTDSIKVALFSVDDKKSPVREQLFFYPLKDSDAIEFMLGSTDELYLQLEIIDADKVAYRREVHLSNSAEHITLPYKSEYKDQVTVSVYGIRRMKPLHESHVFSRTVPSVNFEVQLNSLRDHTTPNTEESFTIKAPASEALVSIYDVTTDRYEANRFAFSPIRQVAPSVPSPSFNIIFNHGECGGHFIRNAASAVSAMASDLVIVGKSLNSDEKASDDVAPVEDVRHDFSQTLAFIPMLDVKRGGAKVSFNTREGLTTFKVLVLAHSKDLRSGTATQEFVVSKAIMVQPNLPHFAVAGDRIVLKAPISNLTAEDVKGVASILFTDDAGREYSFGCDDIDMKIPATGQSVASWSIDIPGNIHNMGVTVSFKSEYGCDAEKNVIQIHDDARYVTETESFILGQGISKERIIKDMKKKYGADDAHIRYQEYSTVDALKEVLQKPSEPVDNNMIEWLDCLYVNQMRGCVLGVDSIDVALSRKAAVRLERLQKPDGGWGWFPSCQSSDELTMLFLDRMFYLRELGKIPLNTSINKQIKSALEYIDNRIFEIAEEKNYDWRRLIYYYAARMEHPNFAMSEEIQNILLDMIRKSKQQGWRDLSIMEKAKLLTIYWSTGEAGTQLRLMASLREYAVRNKTVGCYFPNAVGPYRAMLHTEIYAHAVLAQTFAEMEQKDIAQGIFQWLLLQKHNQEWKSNMAAADAVYVLLKYKAKDVKFGAVSYTHYSPLLSVKPSATGMSVKRTYFRDGVPLENGDRLYVGDRIVARYDIDNAENRSFVEMTAERPACFYPVDERSYGFWNLYCSRGQNATTYHFQVLREEDSHFTEEFYVSQEGAFNSGLVEIKSLYAPEYCGRTDALELESESR